MRSLWTRPLTPAELLLAVAIVAILVYGLEFLMVPRGTPRDQARRVACLSHCKQIALAFQMYAQDYDDSYPRQGSGRGNDVSGFSRPGAPPNWVMQLLPYVKNGSVFICPSAAPSGASMKAQSGAAAEPSACSYLMNGCFNGLRKSEVEQPAAKVMGSCWPFNTRDALMRPGNQDPRWTSGSSDRPRSWANHVDREGRHGRNCFMGDGHACYFPEARLTRDHFAVGPHAVKILRAQP